MTFLKKIAANAWTRWTNPNLTVGAVTGARPTLAPGSRELMRVTLPTGERGEIYARQILNTLPAIDVVDDPLGMHHEAVPYETLVFCGPKDMADSLKMTLPRFFEPLAFRPLRFEVQHAVTSDAPSMLIGDLLEPGLGRACGTLRIKQGDAYRTPMMPNPGGGQVVSHLRRGQSSSVVALGPSPEAEGLVWIDLGRPDTALVVTPGPQSPIVILRQLLPRQTGIGHAPVLGTVLAEAHVSFSPDFGLFQAVFDTEGISVQIVPDNAFSRVISQQRTTLDMLEIMGVFVPFPGRVRSVLGTAIRLDAQQNLLTSGFRQEAERIVLVGKGERSVLKSDGTHQRLGNKGQVPDSKLRLLRPGKATSRPQEDWGMLTAGDAHPMGWIPLRLGDDALSAAGYVRKSAVSYARSGWVAASEVSDRGAMIYLDWLDHAIQLVVRDGVSGSKERGLASFCAEQGAAFSGALTLEHGALRLQPKNQILRDRQTFRLGPLWLRVRRAQSVTCEHAP